MDNKRRNFVFIIFCLLFVMVLFLRSSPAVMVHDLMEAFSITSSSLGVMSAVYFWVYGFVQVPVGILSDRIGVRYTVFIFGTVGVVGAFLFAFSQTWEMATTARFLTGLGTAGIWVPALKYLSLSYSPQKFASLTGVISSVGCVGLIFSSYPLAYIIERTGWRSPFLVSSIILLVFIICAWILMESKPNSSTTEQDKGSSSQNAGENEKSRFVDEVKRYYKFIYFIAWAFFVYGVLFSFQMLWGVAYLQDTFSIDREIAGLSLMFASFGLIIGGPFWGVVSDRILKARKSILVWGTLGFLAILVLFLCQTYYWGFWIVSFKYFFLGFFGSVFLINMTCVKEYFPLKITGTALGILNTLMIISVGIFQGITGLLIEHFNASLGSFMAYFNVFLLYCICIGLAFIITFFMPETYKKS